MVKDAYPFLIVIGLGVIVTLGLGWYWVGGILAFLLVFVGWFFRNPDREVPSGEDLVVSPADGLVVVVKKIDLASIPAFGPEKGEGTLVSIFLSVFDVHVNRSPIGGVITRSEYRRGKFLVASLERASQENEQQIVTVTNQRMTVVFRMIAGLIARRIVFWKSEGVVVGPGERVGLIKFGSRVDLILPSSVVVEVSKGQRVRGGSSIIGRVVA
ncbi:MAG: phosphatidylserine decarboxylase [Blastocatellia bacterium]